MDIHTVRTYKLSPNKPLYTVRLNFFLLSLRQSVASSLTIKKIPVNHFRKIQLVFLNGLRIFPTFTGAFVGCLNCAADSKDKHFYRADDEEQNSLRTSREDKLKINLPSSDGRSSSLYCTGTCLI